MRPRSDEASASLTRRLRLPAALLAAVVAVAALAQTAAGQSLMRSAGLAHTPAASTALAFTDPGGLPTSLPAGHVGLTVSFTINNASESAASYRWTIELVYGKEHHRAASGQTDILANETKAETRQVSTFCPRGQLEIVVRLATPAESIHFRAACGG
jgi:hypothetical protein